MLGVSCTQLHLTYTMSTITTTLTNNFQSLIQSLFQQLSLPSHHHNHHNHTHHNEIPLHNHQRSLSSSSAYPASLSREITSWLAPLRLVCLSLYSFTYTHIFYYHQVRRALIHLSRSSAMVPLVPSGCVIGMGPYPPIHLFPPCSVDRVRGQSGPGSGS